MTLDAYQQQPRQLSSTIEGFEDFDRWGRALMVAAQIAERIAGTEFVPAAMRGKPDVVVAAILYGAEIGVTPMVALQGIHVVEGRPSPSAELMRGMILRAGHDITVHDMTGTRCRISGLRHGAPGTQRMVVEWTSDMARAAGLLNRPVWQRYPRAMLLARATSDLARALFPDVVKGLGYIAEETATDLDQWAAPEISLEPEQPARAPVKRARKPRSSAATLKSAEPAQAPQKAPEPEPEPEDDPWSAGPSDSAPPSLPVVPPGPDYPIPRPAEPEPEPPPVAPPWPTPEQPVVDVPLLPPLEPEPGPREPEPDPRKPIGPGMLRGLHAAMGRILGPGYDREDKIALVAAIVGRDIGSTSDLTRAEGMTVTGTLMRIESGAAAYRFLEDGRIVIDEREPPIDAP